MMAEKSGADRAPGYGVRSFLAASPSTPPSHGQQYNHHHHHHHSQEGSSGGAAHAWAGQPQQQPQQQQQQPLPGSFIPYDLGIPRKQQPQHQHHVAMQPSATADMGTTQSAQQQHGQSAWVGFQPESAKSSSRKRPAMQQPPNSSDSPFLSPLPPPSQHRHQQHSVSGQVLGENCIPVLKGVRQGELRNGVGLLPSLYADFMRGYEKPPKGRRAPREDLTAFTAEQKVERRKARARIYSDVARRRQDSINDKLKRDVVYMRCFRDVVEQAPCLMAVLAPDLDAQVLFANVAFDRLLQVPAASVMGTSLWEWVHGDDRARLQAAFTTVVLTKDARVPLVRCRIRNRGAAGADLGAVEVAFRRGTQGIMCSLWVE